MGGSDAITGGNAGVERGKRREKGGVGLACRSGGIVGRGGVDSILESGLAGFVAG